MSEIVTFDSVWEDLYSTGRQQRYPWDSIVTFVFRHAPRDRARKDVSILEVGAGSCSNLWFAAREGFSVAAIEGSASAIDGARRRFAEDGLEGDLRVGDMTAPLPFEDGSFDLVIDRGALTCCGRSAVKRTIAEVRRVLRPGGKFFFTPFSDLHLSAASGVAGPDGVRQEISAGHLVGIGQISFWNEQQIADVLAGDGPGWRIISQHLLQRLDYLAGGRCDTAEWQIIVEKC